MANTLSSRNTSGTKGVHFVSSRNKWSANITFQGKRYWLGRYTDKEGAINARKEAEARLHGDFLDWYNSREEDSNKE
ncbi:hypothetical protein YDYSY3_38320 [Paenibacillus chitinolyticus]|nr:hypothetical protein YDYSY3_38320 [Paenibacillus chitinolyticus]